jgi:hypothetical protein
VLGRLTADFSTALNVALLVAAGGLVASALYLRHEIHRHPRLEDHCHA